jgi:hypothetical protein
MFFTCECRVLEGQFGLYSRGGASQGGLTVGDFDREIDTAIDEKGVDRSRALPD